MKRRQLTPGQEARLDAIRRASHLLDSVARLPGTSIRVGLDPILGLIPGLGDLISPLFSIAVLWQSRDLGLPRVVQLRMLLNVIIDIGIGIVPFLGDVADVFWKSNSKNMALLERHADEVRPATPGDWLFVVGILAVVIAVALVPLFMMYWIVTILRNA